MAIADEVYRAPARWLHWGMALLVIPMIAAGIVMTQEGIARPLQNNLYIFHKNVGVLLLGLIVLRALYRWRNPPPPEPSHLADWQIKAAAATHGLLYVLLFVMPISGYIRVKAGGFPIESLDSWGVPVLVPRSDALAGVAQTVHYFASWAIFALIVLHIGAALQHAIIKKDGVFARMWPSEGKPG